MPSPDGHPDPLQDAWRRAVTRALAEDLATAGDLTSWACVPASANGRADVVARSPGVLAGLPGLVETYAQVDPHVEVEVLVTDGASVEQGQILAHVSGGLRSVMTGERTALNLLGHLSGIATATAAYVRAVRGTGCAVRDTRKTTPGLRLLEKAAVTVGGGSNHRVGLHDALLVKDNHIAAAGGVGAATRAALQGAGGRPVQVEVSSAAQALEAVEAGAEDLLVDNLSPTGVKDVVEAVAGRAAVEASGSITLRDVRAYATVGADRVAVGAITHSATWLDIAMDVVRVEA